jgi:hypothetical protein
MPDEDLVEPGFDDLETTDQGPGLDTPPEDLLGIRSIAEQKVLGFTYGLPREDLWTIQPIPGAVVDDREDALSFGHLEFAKVSVEDLSGA